MRVATLRGEHTLSELARRLFRIEGPGAEALRQEAEAALLRANPHLRDLQNLAEGAVVVVPAVADIEPSQEGRPLGVGEAGMLGEVPRMLGEARAALAAALTRHAEAASETLKLVESRELKAAAETDPALKERLAGVAEQARTRLDEARTLEAFQDQALTQLDRDLGDLLKRLG